jgi:hypothetical protein
MTIILLGSTILAFAGCVTNIDDAAAGVPGAAPAFLTYAACLVVSLVLIVVGS